jgi:hypothetical protein
MKGFSRDEKMDNRRVNFQHLLSNFILVPLADIFVVLLHFSSASCSDIYQVFSTPSMFYISQPVPVSFSQLKN